MEARGATASWDDKSQTLHINQELRVWVLVVHCQLNDQGNPRWIIGPTDKLKPDVTLALRLDDTNERVQDYYLLPAMENDGSRICLAPRNGIYRDAYRFETPDFLVAMAARVKLSEVP